MMERGVDPWGNSPDAVCIVAGYAPEFGSNDEVTLGDDEFPDGLCRQSGLDPQGDVP